MLFNFGGKTPPLSEDLQERDFLALGSASEVRQRISELLGDVDWSDPTWGSYHGDGFAIEFSLEEEGVISNVGLRITGGGDAIAAIVRVAKPLSWSAY